MADVEAAGLEIVLWHLVQRRLDGVEVVDAGAEDLHAPLIRLEELPGAGGRVAVSRQQAAQIDSHPFEPRPVLRRKVGADGGEVAEAIRPDAHADQGVGGRTAQGVHEGAPVRQDDVVDDEAGVGDEVRESKVESRKSKVESRRSNAEWAEARDAASPGRLNLSLSTFDIRLSTLGA